jgi:two-component system, cell cycle response regulator DivK
MNMPARILIIEDDPASLELVQYLLDSAGYATLTATDGGAGLELALSVQPDLLICDLQMPIMTGYEVVERLRGGSTWRRVPLVAVSAFSMPGDREAALTAGFDAYHSKPIVPETFVRDIERLLPPALRAPSSPSG